jgi:hypothetical protein
MPIPVLHLLYLTLFIFLLCDLAAICRSPSTYNVSPGICCSRSCSPHSSKREDGFRTARKVLFITAALLRTVRDLHGGVL